MKTVVKSKKAKQGKKAAKARTRPRKLIGMHKLAEKLMFYLMEEMEEMLERVDPSTINLEFYIPPMTRGFDMFIEKVKKHAATRESVQTSNSVARDPES